MPFNDKERDLLVKASNFNNFNDFNNSEEGQFYRLFFNYAKKIISRQFCWNHDLDPEDLVQETIIKALNNEDKYELFSNNNIYDVYVLYVPKREKYIKNIISKLNLKSKVSSILLIIPCEIIINFFIY